MTSRRRSPVFILCLILPVLSLLVLPGRANGRGECGLHSPPGGICDQPVGPDGKEEPWLRR